MCNSKLSNEKSYKYRARKLHSKLFGKKNEKKAEKKLKNMFYNLSNNSFAVHFNERLVVCNSPATPDSLP